MDLAKDVSARQTYKWDEGLWKLGTGYARPSTSLGTNDFSEQGSPSSFVSSEVETRPHVVAIDYGIKRNILRNLVDAGARVTVLPATATFEEIMAHEPDGLFLSNGPGDPAATGVYA